MSTKNLKIIITILIVSMISLIFYSSALYYQNYNLKNDEKVLHNQISSLNDQLSQKNNTQRYPTSENFPSQDIFNDFDSIFKDQQNNLNFETSGINNLTFSNTININGKKLSYTISQNGNTINGKIQSNDTQLLKDIEGKIKDLGVSTNNNGKEISIEGKNIDINTIIQSINNFSSIQSAPTPSNENAIPKEGNERAF